MRTFMIANALAAVTIVAACGDNTKSPDDNRLVRTELRWRRHHAILADLGRALELSPEEVCRDADGAPCAIIGPVTVTEYLQVHRGVSPDNVEAVCAQLQGTAQCDDSAYVSERSPKGVHVFSLGGNEPFLGTYTPLTKPGLTTPLVLERVALLACGERARRDQAGTPVVFKDIDLSLTNVTPQTAGLEESIRELYRRLLARDATDTEVAALLTIADGPEELSAVEAVRLVCFAIATTTEAVYQ